MRWQEFAEAAPDLARLGRDRLERQGLALVGTLRRDGSPRISPVEPYFVGEELMLGMMWHSMKALDLLRDARVVVHSATTDREGLEGDFKLYGTAVPRDDPVARAGYSDATFARIDWRPPDPFSPVRDRYPERRVRGIWGSATGLELVPGFATATLPDRARPLIATS